MPVRTFLVMLATLALARPALATEDEAGRVYPGPFDRVARNFLDSFAGPGLAFQLAGVAATIPAGAAPPIPPSSWGSPARWRCSAGCTSRGA
jgi:hypothetical protein